MGLSWTGSRCLFVTRVSGLRRLPVPPASTTPFIPVLRSADQFARPIRFSTRLHYRFEGTLSQVPNLRNDFFRRAQSLQRVPTATRPPLFSESARAIFDRYFIDKSSELQY